MNVWRGLLGNSSLTGDMYEFFLRNGLPGLLKNISLMVRGQMYVQHDRDSRITLGM